MEATRLQAAQTAAAVLSSFVQQPQDMKTMLRLLTEMLVGEELAVLEKMANPRLGVASQHEFFSLAAVKTWLNQNAPDRPFKPLPRMEEPEVAPEERARRVNMLKATAEVIRDTVKAKCVGRPSGQIDDWGKRLEAMAYLDAMRPQSEEVSE